MKIILKTNPTYTPTTKILNFNAIPDFDIRGLLAVLNQTRGDILYSAAATHGGWNASTKELTLASTINTALHSATDILQVIYDVPQSSTIDTPAIAWSAQGHFIDTVVTSQPATLLSVFLTEIAFRSSGHLMRVHIYSGATKIISQENLINYAFPLVFHPAGIACPEGIKITAADPAFPDQSTHISYRLL